MVEKNSRSGRRHPGGNSADLMVVLQNVCACLALAKFDDYIWGAKGIKVLHDFHCLSAVIHNTRCILNHGWIALA